MSLHFTEAFRYMAGSRVECVFVTHEEIICSTPYNVLVWNKGGKVLSEVYKPGLEVISIISYLKKLFLVTSKALYNIEMKKVADIEFSSCFLENLGLLFAVGQNYITIINKECVNKIKHTFKSGICTGIIQSGNFVYISFENGKIFKIKDISNISNFEDLVYFKESIINIVNISNKILVGMFDKKIAILSPESKEFIFTRVKNDIKKVDCLDNLILVLEVEGNLIIFDRLFKFLELLGDNIADFKVSGTSLIIANFDRQIIEYEKRFIILESD